MLDIIEHWYQLAKFTLRRPR